MMVEWVLENNRLIITIIIIIIKKLLIIQCNIIQSYYMFHNKWMSRFKRFLHKRKSLIKTIFCIVTLLAIKNIWHIFLQILNTINRSNE